MNRVMTLSGQRPHNLMMFIHNQQIPIILILNNVDVSISAHNEGRVTELGINLVSTQLLRSEIMNGVRFDAVAERSDVYVFRL